MTVTVTMLQTRRGEGGATWTVGNSYQATDGFAAFLITSNLATGVLPQVPASSLTAAQAAAVASLVSEAEDLLNVTTPIVMRETTTGPHYLLRHQSQASTAGGYEFSFGHNGGAAFTQGPTGEPNYIDDVWWFGLNSAGADIPVDASKPSLSMQFESKYAQGGASSPFGTEFHITHRPKSGGGTIRRFISTFFPHDLSTEGLRNQFSATFTFAKCAVQDMAGANRLQAVFTEGGAGLWYFGAMDSLRMGMIAGGGTAPFYQRNAENSADVALPFYDADNRIRLEAATVYVGATPTGGTYANTFAVWQATSGVANGTLAYFQSPNITGAYTAARFDGAATGDHIVRNYNSSNTSNARAVFLALSREAGGDAVFVAEANGQRTWALGLDRDQSFRFALSKTSTLGSGNDVLQIETTNVWFVANCTAAPGSNASGGGNLYVEAGALKWRGSGGTITTLGAA